MKQEKFTIQKSLLWIVFSTLVVSGSIYTLFFCYQKFNRSKITDSHYQITSVLQMNHQTESLEGEYLAELMELSKDFPKNLHAFDTSAAEKKLLTSPLIREAKVKKVYPQTVFVEYEMREPIAILLDYENTALDLQKHIFPINPFFSPKKLPEIYLGLPEFGCNRIVDQRKGGSFDEPVENPYMDLALKIYRIFQRPEFKQNLCLRRIDVSNAFADSYGRREIVVKIEESLMFDEHFRKIVCTFPRTLRINSKEYNQQLYNFLSLSSQIKKDYASQIEVNDQTPDFIVFEERIVDLRIPKLAFVQDEL